VVAGWWPLRKFEKNLWGDKEQQTATKGVIPPHLLRPFNIILTHIHTRIHARMTQKDQGDIYLYKLYIK